MLKFMTNGLNGGIRAMPSPLHALNDINDPLYIGYERDKSKIKKKIRARPKYMS